HYHSIHGAYTESRHVFINNGLEKKLAEQKEKIFLLEVGFGTGLNAILTALESEKSKTKIYYVALEPYPLPEKIISSLQFQTSEPLKRAEEWFPLLHAKASIGDIIQLHPKFEIMIAQETLEEFPMLFQWDLVYFDAFGPQVQPEIWSKENFEKIYNGMRENGLLVTYCAKGEVRRILQSVGFAVERLPGPPGKRHMLRATKV
ncbi:MAG: tRNA (5-methylaminomethyl-2-thiouridine)(34)-methyltransferase MnmD, partial [Chitinophagales bacterium]|nr:tRNA (5-methylaminomethyl-2-thiouridine)(34)-methyltransferase MnmD [Chitinophagales bacterium]